jgi:hypothetical protein
MKTPAQGGLGVTRHVVGAEPQAGGSDADGLGE